jgi:hypothetical protein
MKDCIKCEGELMWGLAKGVASVSKLFGRLSVKLRPSKRPPTMLHRQSEINQVIRVSLFEQCILIMVVVQNID